MNKQKILVIEDNQEVRENLEEILELSGYEVHLAEDGTVGVDAAQRVKPDLILCDVMMPKLDGFGVLNILGKRPETAAIPFVFLTAKTERVDFRRGMNLGADDYITKPFFKDELLAVIETRLKKSEHLRKQFDRTEQGITAFINAAKGYEELKKLSDNRKIKHYKSGKEYIIDIYTEGDFIGYVDLIKDSTYDDSAAALEDAEVSLIPKEDFTALLHANRDVSSQLIKMLANNIAEKEEQLLQLAYNSVRKRVADAVLLLAEKEGRDEINVLRDDLARIVGTAKESVIRMLTEFKQDGYIDITDGMITIRDKKKLMNMPA